MEDMDAKHLENAICGLTRSMWAIATGIIALAVNYAVLLIAPELYHTAFSDAATVAMEDAGFESAGDGPRLSMQLEHPGFHEPSAEEQVEAASVVAIARYQEDDDSKLRAIITEILKKTPGTSFYWSGKGEL